MVMGDNYYLINMQTICLRLVKIKVVTAAPAASCSIYGTTILFFWLNKY